MSSGVTPILRPPIVIAGFVEIGVRIPMRCAVAAMWPVPTSIPTSAYTELSDYVVASSSVREPA